MNAGQYRAIAQKYLDKVTNMYGDENVDVKLSRAAGAEAGEYDDGSVYLKIHDPKTPAMLYMFIHECGHLLLKHSQRIAPRNIAEFEADEYATKAMNREGIPIPPGVVRNAGV